MVAILDIVEGLLIAIGIVVLIMYYLESRVGSGLQGTALSAARAAAAPVAKKAVDDEAVYNGPPITIIFGSQSGIGESFAEGLAKEAKSRGLSPKLCDIESFDYQSELASTGLLVMYISTHGEGDPPDSTVEFDEWFMSKDRDSNMLKNVTFAVFGLGNKQYEHFNRMGKKFDKRFEALGATRLLEVGLGDDEGSIEEDNENWRMLLWPLVSDFVGLDMSAGDEVPVYEPSFRIIYSEELKAGPMSFRNRRSSHVATSSHRIVPVQEVRELLVNPPVNTSTVHIALDLTGLDLPYVTAHNLGVHPRNDFKVIAQLCVRLGVDPDAVFTMKRLKFASDKKFPVPSPCSVRDALLWHTDLMNPPRKAFIGFLSQYASDPAEKTRLSAMSLPVGKDDYHEHLIVDKQTIPELLTMFPSIQLPFEHFLEECPSLKPRMFTISSSALRHPDQVHITVAVARTEKANGRVHDGVCSTFLANLRPGKDMVCVFSRESLFNLPPDQSTPVIMVGPGTGVAPFRAFVQEGMHCREQSQTPVQFEWHLFFGCRNQSIDFLYEDELREAERVGVLKGLYVAFSRDTPGKKVYVQDLMEQKAELLWELIDKRLAKVFVCGSTDMGKGVREVLHRIVEKYSSGSADSATAYIKAMNESGRFVSELWG